MVIAGKSPIIMFFMFNWCYPSSIDLGEKVHIYTIVQTILRLNYYKFYTSYA